VCQLLASVRFAIDRLTVTIAETKLIDFSKRLYRLGLSVVACKGFNISLPRVSFFSIIVSSAY